MNRYTWFSLLTFLGLLVVAVLGALNETRHWIGAQWFCIFGFWLGVLHAQFVEQDRFHRIMSTNALGKP